jgi:hypothetical protein
MGKVLSNWRQVVAWALALACAVTVVVQVQASETGGLEQAFCICLMLAGAVLIGVPSGRPAFGLFLCAVLMGAVQAANEVKNFYLHSPLMLPDLRYAIDPQTIDVLMHYRRAVRQGVQAGVGALLVVALIWIWSGPSLWRRVQRRGRRLSLRAWATVASLVVASMVVGPWGPFRSLHERQTWEFLSKANEHPLTTFFLSVSRMRVVLPEHDASRLAKVDWTLPVLVPPVVGAKPDILAVLEESTFPPRLLEMCDRAECDAAMFQADAHTMASGSLYVHTFGGATWTSEFAFLAGLPHTLFGPAGIYAPYNLVPRLRISLPRVLKAHGYRTIGIYPMSREFGNAGNAYAAYGFDALYDASDLNLRWESPDTEFASRVEEIWRREREQADGAPLFVFALTMRQHGPHADALDSLPPPFDHALFPKADEATNLALGNYLARLHQSDEAMKQFERLVLGSGRPGVLLHFGDHQPAFDGLELRLPKRVAPDMLERAYALTYFMLKSTPVPAAPAHAERFVDVAFLPGLLLQAARLDPGPYFAANIRLREMCEARFDLCSHDDLLQSFYTEVFDRQGVLGP